MNQASVNPYAAPNADAASDAETPREPQLLPLWLWLAVAVVVSFLGTPADPASMVIALAYGLVSFCVGAVLGSSANLFVRVIPSVLWIIPTIALVLLTADPYFILSALCYLIVSIVFGFWASRRIKRGRLRIILGFAAGYILGLIDGGQWTVVGAVLGTLLAERSLPKPRSEQ